MLIYFEDVASVYRVPEEFRDLLPSLITGS